MNYDEFVIPAAERPILRELASRQAEYAALPVMAQRKQMWYDLNDGRPGARPPVVIEARSFMQDLVPDELLRCTSPAGRAVEKLLWEQVRTHTHIDDDKVVPHTFDIQWFTEINEFGVRVERESARDTLGRETGYRDLHPIQNLANDLGRLRPATCRVDRKRTLAWQAVLTDLLGDLLPVEIHPWPSPYGMLTNRVVELMGMQAFLLAMYDQPAAVHQLMAYLRDNALRIFHWSEAEGLLRLNNGNQDSFGSSFNFTTRLPAPDYTGGAVRLRDLWGCANTQETVGISPRMFREFCLPYYRDVCAPFGLIYFGCCEAAHPFWNDLRHLPHLKKISISRWCQERFMGEALQGTDLVYSRKPDPNLLGVDPQLDEDAWTAHIRTTLEATRGVFVEFIVRDVYTVHGNLDKVRRAVALARAEIDRHYQP